VAAQYSRAIRPFDAAQADRFLAQARKAYEWALRHQEDEYELKGMSYGRIPWKMAWAWAAAELYKTTGEERYHKDFLALAGNDKETFAFQWGDEDPDVQFFRWTYASMKDRPVDTKVQQRFADHLVRWADAQLRRLDSRPYRISSRTEGSYGQLGGAASTALAAAAYVLTGEQKYLDGASLNADWELGANPLSRSFIAALGDRPPLNPVTRYFTEDGKLLMQGGGGAPMPGAVALGPSWNDDHMGERYPAKIPGWRAYLDDRFA